MRGFKFLDHPLRLIGVGVASPLEYIGVAVNQRIKVTQAQQVGDEAAARVRDKADLRADRQCARQRDRVLDRALGERAVLEGIDAAGELRRQRPPQIAVAGTQIAEAAQGARSRAVDEHQHWAFSRWHWLVRRVQIDGFEVTWLAAGTDPAVQPRLLVEPLLDRPHQGFGAGP